MEKSTSEFNSGLRPLMFSRKLFEEAGTGWMRVGEDICYRPNQYLRDIRGSSVHYYTLSFTVSFPRMEDTCWFAVFFPYTLTDLKAYICRTAQANEPRNIMRWSSLCKTLGGNDCDLVTITNFNASATDIMRRKYVVVTARVHPGESQSSFVAEGLVDYLLGDSAEVRALREVYVFKVIPMLNPDGVVEGNHRCSLAGADLNRVWA
jgi:murein tripeptide amidase MpaA